MPITPFHFGAGAAVHAIARPYCSFIAFCTANCIIDVETVSNVLRGRFPLHQFLHSFLGASLAAVATVTLFHAMRAWANCRSLPNPFQWQKLTAGPVVVGAVLGSYSHAVFDGIMHADVRPFAPWDDSNPFYQAIPLASLHWALFIAGVAGAVITLFWRTHD